MKSNSVGLGALLCIAAVFLIAPAGASAMDRLDDVACTATSFCLTVGASDADGPAQAQARRWNGSTWTDAGAPTPDGATQSALAGISCVSATSCVAVGDYADEEEETTLALAMRWDGSDWDIESLPTPAGALSSTLAEVTCTAATACTAVGSYVDSAEVRKAMAIRWNGSSWSLQSVPFPSGAGLSELVGISCTAESECLAVGSFVNSAEVTKTLATVWKSGTWVIAPTPEPAGAELSQLYDVSCLPSDACTAVGTYFDSGGNQKTLALRRSSAAIWSIQSTPNQSGALSNSLTGVYCPTSTLCYSIGVIEQGSKDLPIMLAWGGGTWGQLPIDAEALGASSVRLQAISCFSPVNCKTAGVVAFGRSAADRNLVYTFDSATWTVSEAGIYHRAWLRLDASAATRQLNGISCVEALSCFAVGGASSEAGIRGGQVAVWSGEDWSIKAAAAPPGAKASELFAVSCVSSSSCKAVGRFTNSEGNVLAMVQSWNGSAWSIQSAPAPAGAEDTELLRDRLCLCQRLHRGRQLLRRQRRSHAFCPDLEWQRLVARVAPQPGRGGQWLAQGSLLWLDLRLYRGWRPRRCLRS